MLPNQGIWALCRSCSPNVSRGFLAATPCVSRARFQTCCSLVLSPNTAASSARCPLRATLCGLLGCILPQHYCGAQPGDLALPLAPYPMHWNSSPPLLQASPWRSTSSVFHRIPCYTGFSQLPDILQGQGSLVASSIWLSTLDPLRP